MNKIKSLEWVLRTKESNFLKEETEKAIEQTSELFNDAFNRQGDDKIVYEGFFFSEGFKYTFGIGISEKQYDVLFFLGLIESKRSVSSLEEAMNLCNDMNKSDIEKVYNKVTYWLED